MLALGLCVFSVAHAFREREYAWLAVTPLAFIFAIIGWLANLALFPFHIRQASTCGVKGDTMIPPTVSWPHFVDVGVLMAAPIVAAGLIALLRSGEWKFHD